MAMPAICSIGPKLFVVHIDAKFFLIEIVPTFFDFTILRGQNIHSFGIDQMFYNHANLNTY